MTGNAILREVTLTLPMVPDMEIEASRTATAMAESIAMSPDKIDEVRMAVVEACINAFEHSRSPDRNVYVTFEVLGAPSRAELDALDEEGRRRKVRQVVQRVVVGEHGVSVDLVPGGGAVEITDGRPGQP